MHTQYIKHIHTKKSSSIWFGQVEAVFERWKSKIFSCNEELWPSSVLNWNKHHTIHQFWTALDNSNNSYSNQESDIGNIQIWIMQKQLWWYYDYNNSYSNQE